MRTFSVLRRRFGLAVLAFTASAPAYAQDAGTANGGGARDERAAQTVAEPRWLARPLFGDTDVYVLPRGTAAFAFEVRPTTYRDGLTEASSAYRVEFGLPARFQVALHATGHSAGGESVVGNIDAQAFEVRWAVAGWGRAWGNPTVQAEWQEASRRSDVGTVSVLLGGGGGRWHWGANVGWSQETGGAREVVRAWTAGVSYEGGRFLSVGVESRIAFVDRDAPAAQVRTPMTRELTAGPSVQIRPVRRMYVTLAPLFGLIPESPRSRATLAAGWEF